MKTPPTWDEIRTGIASKDKKHRKVVHQFLEVSADESYLPLLHELALVEDEYDAHFAAATGIARLEGLSRYHYLIETMAEAYSKIPVEDSVQLQTFMEQLRDIALSHPLRTPEIFNNLLYHPRASVRGFVVELWGTQERKEILPSLLNALHDQDSFVRLKAVEACSYYLFPESPEVVPALLPLLNDNDEWVRARVCYVLSHTRDKRQAKEMVIPALKEVSYQDPSHFVRQAATYARRHLDGTEALMSWVVPILICVGCGLLAQLFR